MRLLPPSLVLLLAFSAGAQPSSMPDLPAMDEGIPPARVVTLPEAIHLALAQNVTVGLAIDEYKRSQALTEQARAGWFPTVTGNYLQTRIDADRRITTGDVTRIVTTRDLAAGNLNVTVPLFAPKPFTNWLSVRDLEAALLAGQADALRTVATSVAKAYLTVLAEHRVLAGDLRAVASAQAHVDYAQARYDGGVGNLTDLVRAKQQLSSAETSAAASRILLVRSREQLGVLVSVDQALDVTADVNLPEQPIAEKVALDDANQRPDVKEQEARLRAAEATVAHAWADYVPAVTASFAPFFQNHSGLTQPLGGWQGLVILTWPIYDGGLRYGQEKERRVLEDEARLNLVGTQLEARSEVRTALLSVAYADGALLQARDAARLAHQALQLVFTSYKAGASTNIEVIDAQKQALDSDTAAAVAEDAVRQARVDLLSATGRIP